LCSVGEAIELIQVVAGLCVLDTVTKPLEIIVCS